jgi:hypothetical protein
MVHMDVSMCLCVPLRAANVERTSGYAQTQFEEANKLEVRQKYKVKISNRLES